jgi:hypothetical protein
MQEDSNALKKCIIWILYTKVIRVQSFIDKCPKTAQ